MKKAVVVLIAGSMMTSSAWAARLIEGTVTHDGTPILTVMHSANDHTPSAYLFRKVSGWQATEAGRKLLADGKQKVINGNITISLKHVDRVLVEATVKELDLKAGKDQGRWDLTSGSVEKVAQAAGLEPVDMCKKCDSFCYRAILGEIARGEEAVYSVCMLACTEKDDQAFRKMIRWRAGRILSKQIAESEQEGGRNNLAQPVHQGGFRQGSNPKVLATHWTR